MLCLPAPQDSFLETTFKHCVVLMKSFVNAAVDRTNGRSPV